MEGHISSLPGRGYLVCPTLFCKTSGQPEPHPQNRRNTRLTDKPVSPGGHSDRSPLEGRQSGTLLAIPSVLPTRLHPTSGKDTGHPLPVWWAEGLVSTHSLQFRLGEPGEANWSRRRRCLPWAPSEHRGVVPAPPGAHCPLHIARWLEMAKVKPKARPELLRLRAWPEQVLDKRAHSGG